MSDSEPLNTKWIEQKRRLGALASIAADARGRLPACLWGSALRRDYFASRSSTKQAKRPASQAAAGVF